MRVAVERFFAHHDDVREDPEARTEPNSATLDGCHDRQPGIQHPVEDAVPVNKGLFPLGGVILLRLEPVEIAACGKVRPLGLEQDARASRSSSSISQTSAKPAASRR